MTDFWWLGLLGDLTWGMILLPFIALAVWLVWTIPQLLWALVGGVYGWLGRKLGPDWGMGLLVWFVVLPIFILAIASPIISILQMGMGLVPPP